MKKSRSGTRLVFRLAATLLAACSDAPPLAPEGRPEAFALLTDVPGAPADIASGDARERAIATLRRVTARYHDQNAALRDGFVLLHPCEARPGEGPVGSVYVHMGRLLDGVIDPQSPDALIYEPGRNGPDKLVGVEFALPYGLWNRESAPTFLGVPFQREDEFGVFALHAWVWRSNPNGMFAESNPRVDC